MKKTRNIHVFILCHPLIRTTTFPARLHLEHTCNAVNINRSRHTTPPCCEYFRHKSHVQFLEPKEKQLPVDLTSLLVSFNHISHHPNLWCSPEIHLYRFFLVKLKPMASFFSCNLSCNTITSAQTPPRNFGACILCNMSRYTLTTSFMSNSSPWRVSPALIPLVREFVSFLESYSSYLSQT